MNKKAGKSGSFCLFSMHQVGGITVYAAIGTTASQTTQVRHHDFSATGVNVDGAAFRESQRL
jgi:hypothetical protein